MAGAGLDVRDGEERRLRQPDSLPLVQKGREGRTSTLLAYCIVLRACCAMSGTEIGCGATQTVGRKTSKAAKERAAAGLHPVIRALPPFLLALPPFMSALPPVRSSDGSAGEAVGNLRLPRHSGLLQHRRSHVPMPGTSPFIGYLFSFLCVGTHGCCCRGGHLLRACVCAHMTCVCARALVTRLSLALSGTESAAEAGGGAEQLGGLRARAPAPGRRGRGP
eukprot:1494803-Rhodomonas_salina.1